MNNITVTVTYDKPNTSKFDALMKEYRVAQKLSEETIAYYKPLADVAEEAKFDAIMDQLETIKDYARQISEIKNKESVWITALICGSDRGDRDSNVKFQVVYRPKEPIYKYEILCGGHPFVKSELSYFCRDGRMNFIGKWDEWKVYKQLESDACSKLHDAIFYQNLKAQEQIRRLENVTK